MACLTGKIQSLKGFGQVQNHLSELISKRHYNSVHK